MSDTSTDFLEVLRDRLRSLEAQAADAHARADEVRTTLELLERTQPRRPGRPRKVWITGDDNDQPGDAA